MSHHTPWCGCDPNHLGTHSRGRVAGCKFNGDPKELLIKATEEYLMLPSELQKIGDAKALLGKWMDLDG